MSLIRAVQIAAELREQATLRPLDTWRPLPGQLAILEDAARFRLFRGPNQAIGKTTAGAVDLISSATGIHPWAPSVVTPRPIEAWVLCASWSQSVAIQKKINELLPRDLLHATTSFNEVWGFRPSKSPIIRIRHVSGGWSTIRIKTTQQGGLNLAGATIDFAWFDEPPHSQRVYSEVQKRVMKAGRYGRVLITMTPINAPVDWIKDAVERGQIIDHHHSLEPHELIPVGTSRPLTLTDGTVCDADWIQDVIAETMAHEVPVVCFGEWSFAVENPIFSAYKISGSESHLITEDPPEELELWLGIDHGHKSHSEVAILIGVQKGAGDDHPRIWILAEYVSQGETTEDDDADGVLVMLEGLGLLWSDLAGVYGDRAHYGTNRRGSIAKKSNERLTAALEKSARGRAHGIRPGALGPRIQPAKRGASNLPGSVSYGCTWLHRLMLRPGHFHVHARAASVSISLQKYRMKPNSEWAHAIDAIRYGLKGYIFGTLRRFPSKSLHVW